MLYVQVSMWTSFRVSQPDSCLRKQWQNRSGKTSALGQMVPRSAVVSLEKLAVPGHSQVLYYRVCVGWGVYCYWINWLYLATHRSFTTHFMCVWILSLDKLVVPVHSQVLYYSLCVSGYCYWINWLYLATHRCFITHSVCVCVPGVCVCVVTGESGWTWLLTYFILILTLSLHVCVYVPIGAICYM